MTFLDVMNLWQSDVAFANDLGIKLSRVQKWRVRKQIPPKTWPAVLEASKRRGFSVDADTLLAGLSTRLHNASKAA